MKIKHEVENSRVYLMDCMEFMKDLPDGYFHLACVDPPYGIGEDGLKNHSRGKKTNAKLYTPKNWDKHPPNLDYFDMLKRKSKNQIIWGANHFIDNIPFNVSTSCWLVWDKQNGNSDFADCELAWTSYKTAVRLFSFRWQGMLQGNMKKKEIRCHPTQKPIALYDWIFKNYLPDGGKVFDSHLGSGSSRIAADKAGNIDFTGTEIDEDYFKASVDRFNKYKSQLTLF